MEIPVINFDSKATCTHRRRVAMFPDILRCGIFGPSGCGKSNLLLTMLMYIRKYPAVYICARTVYQEKYQLLSQLINSHNWRKKCKGKIKFITITPNTLPEPEQIEEDAVIIFDDVLTENQSKIANFFLRGRHRRISCIYLSQSYTKIPKKTGI